MAVGLVCVKHPTDRFHGDAPPELIKVVPAKHIVVSNVEYGSINDALNFEVFKFGSVKLSTEPNRYWKFCAWREKIYRPLMGQFLKGCDKKEGGVLCEVWVRTSPRFTVDFNISGGRLTHIEKNYIALRNLVGRKIFDLLP